MTHKGVDFILSNSVTELTEELWAGYPLFKYGVSRSVNRDGQGRSPNKENELLVVSVRRAA